MLANVTSHTAPAPPVCRRLPQPKLTTAAPLCSCIPLAQLLSAARQEAAQPAAAAGSCPGAAFRQQPLPSVSRATLPPSPLQLRASPHLLQRAAAAASAAGGGASSSGAVLSAAATAAVAPQALPARPPQPQQPQPAEHVLAPAAANGGSSQLPGPAQRQRGEGDEDDDGLVDLRAEAEALQRRRLEARVRAVQRAARLLAALFPFLCANLPASPVRPSEASAA